jgi:hypothetical protein
MTPFFSGQLATLYHGDCLATMGEMSAAAVDLVLTDPPYNAGIDYGPGCDDALPPADYHAWLRAVLAECRRVSRDGVLVFPGVKNLLDTAADLKAVGLPVRQVLGWHWREFAGDKWHGGPAVAWDPVIWASAADRPFYRKRFGSSGRNFLSQPLAGRPACPGYGLRRPARAAMPHVAARFRRVCPRRSGLPAPGATPSCRRGRRPRGPALWKRGEQRTERLSVPMTNPALHALAACSGPATPATEYPALCTGSFSTAWNVLDGGEGIRRGVRPGNKNRAAGMPSRPAQRAGDCRDVPGPADCLS